jgi:hypothetical protein
MADIISLNQKLQNQKTRQDAIIRKRKILGAQKMFKCIRCAFKCEKCGATIEFGPQTKTKDRDMALKPPYNLCQSCHEEYEDYINLLKGKKIVDDYWHNDLWAELWKRWIDYQSAVDSYLKSKEFKKLLVELRESLSDNEEA